MRPPNETVDLRPYPHLHTTIILKRPVDSGHYHLNTFNRPFNFIQYMVPLTDFRPWYSMDSNLGIYMALH